MGEPASYLGMLDDADRTALLETGARRNWSTGATVLFEGDASDHVLVVLRGRVKVVSTSREGQELILALRGEGDLLGELAALHSGSGSRSASVIAAVPVTGVVVSNAEFLRFLHTRPAACVALARMLAARLARTERRRADVSLLDVRNRVRRVLLDLVADQGPDLLLSQQDLASMAASTRESVGRVLADLRADGVVVTRRGHITVADPVALEERLS